MGIELLAGVAVSYLVRKLRRVGRRADAAVDRGLDAGVDAVGELVTGRLAGLPALAALEAQASTGDGEVRERTLRQVGDALADAAEDDPSFEERLRHLVTELQRLEETAGAGAATVHQRVEASGNARVYVAGRDVRFVGPDPR